jgi:hypothetical protein
VPVRWVLVRDVVGEHDPQAFLCTDQEADVLRWFVRRWAVEVTFAEVRRHLGVERQWSDNAIARTTPALLALFSLVTLWAHDLVGRGCLDPRSATWYPKRHLTFSDALGAVRRKLWQDGLFQASDRRRDMVKISARPAPARRGILPRLSTPLRKHTPSRFAQSREGVGIFARGHELSIIITSPSIPVLLRVCEFL